MDINMARLVGVQRRTTRFVRSDYKYTSSVTKMMTALALETPAAPHKTKAVIMYQKVNSLVECYPEQHLQPHGAAVMRGHQFIFMVPCSRTYTHRMILFLLVFVCATSFERSVSTSIPLMPSRRKKRQLS